MRDRLHRALSVVYGIEPYMILKDIWGLPDREVERIALWMADALIDAAQRDAAPGGQAACARPRPAGAAEAGCARERRAAPEWFDAQYNNRARIPEHLAILQQWDERSHHARASLSCTLDIAYGAAPSERLDVFAPEARGAPVLVYIHGGYWRALDKRDQSFVAPPFVAAGAMVVLPNYALCPGRRHRAHRPAAGAGARLGLAPRGRARRRSGAHRRRRPFGGRPPGGDAAVVLTGARSRPTCPPTWSRARSRSRASSSSSRCATRRFSPPTSTSTQRRRIASARRRMPAPRGRLVALVGADESEEFKRQNALIASAWGPGAVPVCEEVPGRHHMDVLHELAEPASRTHRLALQLLGL